MLRFAIRVLATLSLLASIALGSSSKVVVLAVCANPATIREVKLVLTVAAQVFCLHHLGFSWLATCALLGFLLLVLAPLGSASVEPVRAFRVS